MGVMIYARYKDLFDYVWPVFWPWLWLQLALLVDAKERDGRDRLIMVFWWGKVLVAVGDDPSAAPAFTPDQVWEYARPLSVGLAHFSTDNTNPPSRAPDNRQGLWRLGSALDRHGSRPSPGKRLWAGFFSLSGAGPPGIPLAVSSRKALALIRDPEPSHPN